MGEPGDINQTRSHCSIAYTADSLVLFGCNVVATGAGKDDHQKLAEGFQASNLINLGSSQVLSNGVLQQKTSVTRTLPTEDRIPYLDSINDSSHGAS